MREMREMRENFLLRWKILLLLLHVHTLVHTHDTLQFILYFIEDPQTTCYVSRCSSSSTSTIHSSHPFAMGKVMYVVPLCVPRYVY